MAHNGAFGAHAGGLDEATQTWLGTACVFGSACAAACKLSYPISWHCSTSYRGLSKESQRDWDSRASSSLHAVVITALAAWIILFTDLYKDDNGSGAPAMLRVSPLTNAALGVSLGYFVLDLAMMLVYYPQMGGAEMVAHHVASLLSVLRALMAQYAHLYTLAMLSTEVTTPFINARWQMDRCGLRAHPAYLANGLVVMCLWAINRIAMFAPFFLHGWRHRDEILPMPWYDKVLLVGVPLMLLGLNCFWFRKMLRVVVKTARVVREKQAKEAQQAQEEQQVEEQQLQAASKAMQHPPRTVRQAMRRQHVPSSHMEMLSSAWRSGNWIFGQTKTEAAVGRA